MQRFEKDVAVAVCLDAVDDGTVVDRLGFQNIGDGDQTHVEALLYLFELPVDGGFPRHGGIQKVLGAQHIEIGLHDAHDQALPGFGQVRFGAGHGCPGAAQVEPATEVDDRLIDARRPLVLIVILVGNGRDTAECGTVRIEIEPRWHGKAALVPGRRPAKAQLREQIRPCLRNQFLARLEAGLGSAEYRIVLHCVPIGVGNVDGAG